MADYIWVGGLAPTKESWSGVMSGVSAGAKWTLTLGTTAVSYTAVAADTIDTAGAAFASAINAAVREWTYASASYEATTDTLTVESATAGRPLTDTSTLIASAIVGTAAMTGWARGTVATGPNHYVAGNFADGVLPPDSPGHQLILQNNSASILWDLDRTGRSMPLCVVQDMSYTGQIGLLETDSAGFPQYFPTFLRIKVDEFTGGGVWGAGSALSKWDCDGAVCAFRVVDTGVSSDSNGALIFKGTTGATTLIQEGGTTSISPFNVVSAVVASLYIGGDAVVSGGLGFSYTNAYLSGNATFTDQSGGIVVMEGGTYNIIENIVTALTMRGSSSCNHSSAAGAITTLTMDSDGASVDFGNTFFGTAAITNVVITAGTITDETGRITKPAAFTGWRSLRVSRV